MTRHDDYLNPDGSLIVADWAEWAWLNDDRTDEVLEVDRSPHEHPMYGSNATGDALVGNGFLGVDHIRVPAGGGFAPHTHPGDHLLIVTGGLGTVTYDGRIYPTHAGQVYMIEGTVPHAVGAITDHTILAVGAPHRPVDSADRMTLVDYAAVGTALGMLRCLICGKDGDARGLADQGCTHAPVQAPGGKLLFVGIAPATPRHVKLPAFVETKSGRRLSALLGIEPSQITETADTTNVFKEYVEDWQRLKRGDWSEASAALLGELEGRVVVACGHQVARACGAVTDRMWGNAQHVSPVGYRPWIVLTIPHPSGMSRAWNEPGMTERARAALAVARTLASSGPPLGDWQPRDAVALETITLPAFAG